MLRSDASRVTLSSPTIPRLIKTRAAAIRSAIPFPPPYNNSAISPSPSQDQRTYFCLDSTSPLSPAASSPSAYSHQPHGISPAQAMGLSAAGQRLRIMSEGDSDNYHFGHDNATTFDMPEDMEDRRMSIVSGPKMRKYVDDPWGPPNGAKEWLSTTGQTRDASGITKMIRAAAGVSMASVSPSDSARTDESTDSARRQATRQATRHEPGEMSRILGTTNSLLPSASDLSLVSDQTASTLSSAGDERHHPTTPKLQNAFGIATTPSRKFQNVLTRIRPPTRPGTATRRQAEPIEDSNRIDICVSKLAPGPGADRPLLASGSPGFGLISLEAARERERLRSLGQRWSPPAEIDQTQAGEDLDGDNRIVSSPSQKSGNSARKIRTKKSGLMKLFQGRASAQAPLPTNPRLTIGDPIVTVPQLAGPVVKESHQAIPRSSLDGRPTMGNRTGSMWSNTSGNDDQSEFLADRSTLSVLIAKPKLELRPVSMTFARGLPVELLVDQDNEVESRTEEDSPSSDDDPHMLREQLANVKKTYHIRLAELEAQVRELGHQLQGTKERARDGCATCGCNCAMMGDADRLRVRVRGGVMDRGRAKTGGARGVFGSGSLYEWE